MAISRNLLSARECSILFDRFLDSKGLIKTPEAVEGSFFVDQDLSAAKPSMRTAMDYADKLEELILFDSLTAGGDFDSTSKSEELLEDSRRNRPGFPQI